MSFLIIIIYKIFFLQRKKRRTAKKDRTESHSLPLRAELTPLENPRVEWPSPLEPIIELQTGQSYSPVSHSSHSSQMIGWNSYEMGYHWSSQDPIAQSYTLEDYRSHISPSVSSESPFESSPASSSQNSGPIDLDSILGALSK